MDACLNQENHTGQRSCPDADDNEAVATTTPLPPTGPIITDNRGLDNHNNGHLDQQLRSTPLLIRTSSGQQQQKHRRPATNVSPATIACDRRPALSTFRGTSNISRKSNHLNSICKTDSNNNNSSNSNIDCNNFTNPLKQLAAGKVSTSGVAQLREPPNDIKKNNNNNNNSDSSNSSINYPLERNSLESIHSKFSISSANDQPIQLSRDNYNNHEQQPIGHNRHHQFQSTSTTSDIHSDDYDHDHYYVNNHQTGGQIVEPTAACVELSTFSKPENCIANNQRRLVSPNVALIATKYISPPTVDGKLIKGSNLDTELRQQETSGSKCCWRNIPLDDNGESYHLKHSHQHHYQDDDGVQINHEHLDKCDGTGIDSAAAMAPKHQAPLQNERASSQVMSDKNSGYKKQSIMNKSSLADKELVSIASKGQKQNFATSNGSRRSKNIDNDANLGQLARGGRGPNDVAPFPFAGILASILGSVFFSISVLCIKLLPDDNDSGIIEKTKALFIRGCCFMVLCGTTIIVQRSTFLIRRDELLVNILRSIFGVLGVYGLYISLKYISLGDATALVFSSPIWTSILSHLILKEPFQLIQILALPASMFGILLIAHPALIIKMDHVGGDYERQPILLVPENSTTTPLQSQPSTSMENLINQIVVNVTNITSASTLLSSELDQLMSPPNNSASPIDLHHQHYLHNQHLVPLTSDLDSATMSSESSDFEHRWPGVVIALCTSFIVSIVYIVLKFRKTTPIQTTTFWLGFASASCSLLVMSFVGFASMPATIYEWILLLGNAFTSWLGQALIQWALMHEDASILSVVRTLDVAMTFTLSALFLEEEILWTSIVGATIIGLVVVSIVMNSWIQGVLRARAERHEGDETYESSNNNTDDNTSNELSVVVVSGAGGGCEEKQSYHQHKEKQQQQLVAMDLTSPTRRNTSAAA